MLNYVVILGNYQRYRDQRESDILKIRQQADRFVDENAHLSFDLALCKKTHKRECQQLQDKISELEKHKDIHKYT